MRMRLRTHVSRYHVMDHVLVLKTRQEDQKNVSSILCGGTSVFSLKMDASEIGKLSVERVAAMLCENGIPERFCKILEGKEYMTLWSRQVTSSLSLSLLWEE